MMQILARKSSPGAAALLQLSTAGDGISVMVVLLPVASMGVSLSVLSTAGWTEGRDYRQLGCVKQLIFSKGALLDIVIVYVNDPLEERIAIIISKNILQVILSL